MIRYVALFFLFIHCVIPANSQELNCTVQLEHSKIQSTDPKVFKTLERSIEEFLNTTKWTNDNFLEHERIDCSIIINLDTEYSPSQFGGQIIINAVRPVYNSAYKTILFSYKDDDFKFEYNEYDNLEYSDNNFFSNLTSILAFYSYILLGFDYDSFSPNAGTPYFLKAQTVVTSIPAGQKAKWSGWDPFDGNRNRAILMAHLTNPRYDKFREAIFQYHHVGLDNMYTDPDKSRGSITQAVNLVKAVYDDNPNSMLIKIFFLAKNEELVNIYSNATSSEKNDIIEILSNMDPINTSKYSKIR